MHVLIAGITGSGKSTIAKKLARQYRTDNLRIIVLDPLNDPGFEADFKTTDKYEFLQIVKTSRQCAVFVDESGEMIGKYNDEMFWLATRARHYGHRCHFIVQRPQMLSPTIRTQCTHLFLFRVSNSDAKILADEFSEDEIRNAPKLGYLEYMYVSPFKGVERGKVAFD